MNMKFATGTGSNINLLLRKEEIGKFISTIMYYRYGGSDSKKYKFIDNLQAIRIDEDKVILIDGFGDICDVFDRDGTVTLPKQFEDELFNEFQIVLSVHGNKFYLQELI